MIIRQIGQFSRECGCAWDIIPPSELPERARRALSTGGVISPAARFTHRCPTHTKMCRFLEPWELALGCVCDAEMTA